MKQQLDTKALQLAADDYWIAIIEVQDIVKLYFKYAGKEFLPPSKKKHP